MNILVLNPGSTSTKVAVFRDTEELHKKNLSHSREELSAFNNLLDQLDFRYGLVMDFLREVGFEPSMLDCIMSRGGSPPNVNAGATVIGDRLVTALRERPKEPHPASLGPIIADRIAKAAGIPAYIYDPITADELNPMARVFGVKGIEHDSMCHFLNSHAMGISVAKELGRPFEELNLIVAHFGGGNSMCFWSKGHPIDVIPGDAGTFSSERCGPIRSERLLQLSREYGYETLSGWFHGKGGLVSLLGTNDLRDVEKKIQEGDSYALLVLQAMAYQLAKCIASLFPVTGGEVDGIVLTGGGANLVRLVNEIKSRLVYLNTPIYVRPGENEMQALAEGAYRVMRGEEVAQEYVG
ncbi:MAG: butyrate kinase [Clostridiales bacterium]|nr:butyrate kinase [Clostridiales bacterium]